VPITGTIVGVDGATLVGSAGFASYDVAERAALVVREGAHAARFERRAADDLRVYLVARRDAAPEDDSDAELDEGGSFSSEAVTNGRRNPDRATRAARDQEPAVIP
jgi:hypothetical protein